MKKDPLSTAYKNITKWNHIFIKIKLFTSLHDGSNFRAILGIFYKQQSLLECYLFWKEDILKFDKLYLSLKNAKL